jgi:hypothetical protein
MEPWLVVWLVVGLVTTVMLLVMLGFLVRHTILLGRTAGKMQDELQPIADDLAAASARVAEKAAHLSDRASPSRGSRSRGSRRTTPARGRGPR